VRDCASKFFCGKNRRRQNKEKTDVYKKDALHADKKFHAVQISLCKHIFQHGRRRVFAVNCR
jgi:hypothetical protein